MATEFAFDVASETANGLVSTDRLALETVRATISPSLTRIDVHEGTLRMFFDADLSSPEEAALTALVAAHKGNPVRSWVKVDPVLSLEPVEPGASKVIANDRPAIELQPTATGWSAMQAIWPLAQDPDSELVARIKFILKALGTGSDVRIAVRGKSEAAGEDSSGVFSVVEWVAVEVTHTTLGEVFEGELTLDASSFSLNDSVAIQIGRDGGNTLGAGTSDDVNQAIQILAVKLEAR